MINLNKIRNTLKDIIAEKIDDDLVEYAIYDAIGNMDFTDKIADALAYAVEDKLNFYVEDMIDDVVGEVVCDVVENIFD